MNQLITTTSVENIRPVFAQGAGENIKRYNQLKKLYAQGKEYRVFAEPIPAGTGAIGWHTEYKGTPVPYAQLSQSEKDSAKGILKFRVNLLYKKAIKIITQAKGTTAEILDLFEVIDSCIEIPDYADIYKITDTNGNSDFVLIRWGFTADDFSAKDKLIQKLFPVKVDTIVIKALNQKNEPVKKENLDITYNNKTLTLKTDENGSVFIDDIPFLTAFSVNKTGENAESLLQYTCNGSDEYIYKTGIATKNMMVFIYDEDKIPMPQTTIKVKYDEVEYDLVSDKNGQINIADVPVGAKVQCIQNNAKNYTFTCKSETPFYEFFGERPVATMIIKAIDKETQQSLGRIPLKITYGNRTLELDTDTDGTLQLLKVDVNALVEVYQNSDNQYFNKNVFTAVLGTHTYTFLGTKPALGAPLHINVVNEEGNPIVNAIIKCEFDGKIFECESNEKGIIFLDFVKYGAEIKCTQMVNGVGVHQQNFVFSKDKSEYIFRAMSIVAKSGKSRLEITVLTRRKQPIPNLRVTIENGYTNHNRITNSDGLLVINDIEKSKKVRIVTDYKGNKATKEFFCSEEVEKHEILLGPNPLAFLLWLIPLILILAAAFYFFLLPLLPQLFKPVVLTDTIIKRDTVTLTDTVKNKPVEVKGLTIILLDKKNNTIVANADIEIEYNGLKQTGKTNADGKINFPTVPEKDVEIIVRAKAPGFTDLLANFIVEKEKTLYMSNESLEISEIILPCGKQVESKGYRSTIKTFHVKKAGGRLSILYDMFIIPDEIIIYRGKANRISDDKIIWRSKGFVKGLHRENFMFAAPDSLITVKINGGDESKTEWYFKVYCP